nr:hypothetical protein [Magnetospirillum gryphiswaldense]
MIVPGGGIAPDGRWVSSRPAFLLPVRVLGALCRSACPRWPTRWAPAAPPWSR